VYTTAGSELFQVEPTAGNTGLVGQMGTQVGTFTYSAANDAFYALPSGLSRIELIDPATGENFGTVDLNEPFDAVEILP
jgi:hypothetical protein